MKKGGMECMEIFFELKLIRKYLSKVDRTIKNATGNFAMVGNYIWVISEL